MTSASHSGLACATTHESALYGARINYSGDVAAGSRRLESDYRAPKAMVEEAHRQVERIHDMSYAPRSPTTRPIATGREDPYGGGVNFWRIHAKSWEVIPAIIKPRAGAPIYICGEAYSQQQGWVEGALQTAEMMLQTHFGLLPAACAGAASAPERAKPAPTLTDRLEPAAQP